VTVAGYDPSGNVVVGTFIVAPLIVVVPLNAL
jgi:hypothetical protein